MNKTKNFIALWMIAFSFIFGFFDGLLQLGMSDDAYAILGIISIIGLVWAFIIESKRD